MTVTIVGRTNETNQEVKVMSMLKKKLPKKKKKKTYTAEPCPFCGSTRGLMDLHGSMTCINCRQKVEGCCGGVCPT